MQVKNPLRGYDLIKPHYIKVFKTLIVHVLMHKLIMSQLVSYVVFFLTIGSPENVLKSKK